MTDAHDDATSFVPHLDARQRAMLAEMGVRVWAPRAEAVTAELAPAPVPEVSAPMAPPPVEPRPPAHPAPAAAPRAAPAAPAVAPAAPPTAAERLRPAGVAQMDWPALQAAVAGCEACGLCKTRRNTVFGVGDTRTDWMIVGEAPGENEDLQGEPFVGAAGQLLDNMLRAVGRTRSGEGTKGAYIANVLKCRPPANRNPQPQEVAQCEPYLARQVALVKPKIIVAMGRFAVQSLLRTEEPIGRLRGRVHRYEGVPVIVTYHPAYLLRTPADKAKAWEDLCLAMETAEGL
ncbi:uracil-DNA glycosylase [Hydrogenophaga pseudoflava]|uniref:Type-4 uracil-DNA glycosylase n=1 Tax=Hydrogenophaga pseudoflava TaxID=47421 RepID=A0A4P6X988_HYDPS|nr:uracil-DNA glycosylase [Hydrogenophaga pseudoflava]QBM30421.1 Uracil DNA glycosylase superfamily protein [Hydrogenophaga pseudoflava]